MECFVIFVMAWCWYNATESKPQNVKKAVYGYSPFLKYKEKNPDSPRDFLFNPFSILLPLKKIFSTYH
ncbi:MAG: hypothetical protein L6Q46_05195, partial [Flavobacterium sp.]|uniref:hypothetical protein n=1 Tax=Flavobacterium sp. TaxID=239 RepID=UPI0025C1127C